MIRIFFIILGILYASSHSLSQNIYDKTHSLDYANHLFSNGDFKESAEEYERLLTQVPDSFFIQERIILSYLNAKDYENCKTGIIEMFGSQPELYPVGIMHIYIQLHIILGDYNAINGIIENNSVLSDTEISEYRIAFCLLRERYEESGLIIDSLQKVSDTLSPKMEELIQCHQKALETEYKHPGLAALMSAVIPGTGKAYSDDLQNGIRSFSIIGLYAWQSYRGFHFEGIKSFYGWAFGALACGFYGANIYGSYASAKRTNHYENSIIRKEVKGVILDKEFSRN